MIHHSSEPARLDSDTLAGGIAVHRLAGIEAWPASVGHRATDKNDSRPVLARRVRPSTSSRRARRASRSSGASAAASATDSGSVPVRPSFSMNRCAHAISSAAGIASLGIEGIPRFTSSTQDLESTRSAGRASLDPDPADRGVGPPRVSWRL